MTPAPPFFTLEHTCPHTGARAGTLRTAHGDVHTPIFMPVGTQATVKSVLHEALARHVAPDIILANNYHLYLRPGIEVLRAAGGLHKFMAWQGPILTDSGGYQVYSLAHMRKLKEEGVVFQSHIDGSRHLFTPEGVVDMQRAIGSDIMMVLDECTPYPCDEAYARNSLALTHRWAAQARRHFLATEPLYGHAQFQFGIVQGSTYARLREESAAAIAELDFDGNAIGGLAVGEPAEVMYALTAQVAAALPAHKPRYLMGVGTPLDLLEVWAAGVDMTDCVLPSRNARHGLLFFRDGIRNLKNAKYKNDHAPLDETSACAVDHQFSRAYLRHLFVAEETLAYEIATLHNLHFFLALAREARARILDGTFLAWKRGLSPLLGRRL